MTIKCKPVTPPSADAPGATGGGIQESRRHAGRRVSVGRFSALSDAARCPGGDDRGSDGGDEAGDGVAEKVGEGRYRKYKTCRDLVVTLY